MNERRSRMAPGICCVQPLLVGQEDQQIGVDQVRDEGRQIVVVSDLDFFGRHDVVLVDDRHNLPFEQREERVPRVQIALSIGQIGTREQRLGHNQIFFREHLVPHLHQPGLPDGGQHLLERDVLPVARDRQCLAAGDNSTGRNQRYLVTLAHQTSDLARDAQHGRPLEAVLASGQRVRPDFDDEALLRPVSHLCRCHFISSYNRPSFHCHHGSGFTVLGFWGAGSRFFVLWFGEPRTQHPEPAPQNI